MKKSLWEACVKDLAVLRQRVPESTEKECVEAISKIKKMLKTHDSSNCFGLAANQVGVNTRACLLTIPPHYMPEKKSKDKIIYEFHNPRIVDWSGSAVNQEWCYSLSPKESYIVKRYKEITIQDDKNGMTKLSGVPAYAAQHECLPRRSKIMTEDGSMMIGEIVDQKYGGKAWCNQNGETILKQIIGWSKRANVGKEWVVLKWKNSKFNGPHSELVCTSDHICFVLEDIMAPESISKVKAHDCGGKYLVRYPTGGLRNTEPPLYNRSQLSAIVGCLLGDACVSRSGELCVVHGDSQREYIEYKADIFGGMVNYHKTPNAYGQGSWRFRASVTAQLKHIRSVMYKRRKTTRDITQYIDNIALAFWYMDDGCLIKSRSGLYTAQFHTESFSDEDAELLVGHLKKQFGISSRIYNRKLPSGFKPTIIVGRKTDAEVLFKAIRQFIHPSMRYKLPPEHRSVKFEPIDSARLSYSARFVAAVQPKHCESKLYDIEVEDAHTMFANGALVHNCDHLNGKVICDRGAPAKKIMETISGTQSLNSPCNCGSGKKFKRCCAKKTSRAPEPAK